jgi:hypothetical protein
MASASDRFAHEQEGQQYDGNGEDDPERPGSPGVAIHSSADVSGVPGFFRIQAQILWFNI